MNPSIAIGAFALFSVCCASSSLAQDQAAPVVVRLDRSYLNTGGSYPQGFFGPVGTAGDVVGGIATGVISAAADRLVVRTYASLASAIQNVDLHAELAQAFACIGLDEDQRPCRDVRIIDALGDEPLLPVQRGDG